MKWKRINKSDRKRKKLLAYRVSEMGRITGEFMDRILVDYISQRPVFEWGKPQKEKSNKISTLR